MELCCFKPSAYRQLYPDIAEVALKYFCDHAMQWLTPINVALKYVCCSTSIFRRNCCKRTFPDEVDARNLLKDRSSRLRSFFFTSCSKTAQCINSSEIPALFWIGFENNNRSTERVIGKLKQVVRNKLAKAED